MPILHAIVAMSENRAIAHRGKLPWHLPLEYRWFKHKTMGSTLVMGRKTRESIGRALPGRRNLVLSRGGAPIADSVVFRTVEKLEAELPGEAVSWVVGGAEIYRQFLPRCSLLYLSRIKQVTDGDVFFPAFEGDFDLNQVIHENDDFRVERWLRKDEVAPTPEAWPF